MEEMGNNQNVTLKIIIVIFKVLSAVELELLGRNLGYLPGLFPLHG